jgi:class 3 adenylate cyclase/tetratricopeptide (TPR) repeat protein
MSLVCLSCLTSNPDLNRFCGTCGASLGRAAPDVAPPNALEIPDAQWGAIKHATILFADIVSSTEHVQGLDPEQAMEQLKPAIETMCSSVERFGGTVVRTLGDGVMALFGAPSALEGHASLACESALAMQAAFTGSSKGLQIRVGLHSGQVAYAPEAVAAPHGGGFHGHAIHVASRIVGLAEPGGICMTSDCLALVRAVCDARSLGRQAVKGVADPVDLYQLLSMKNDIQNTHFHEASLSPFRGRDEELGWLKQALADSQEGRGTVIGLSGGPGTGKSRLCHEFAEWCRGRSVPVCTVRTQLYGHATPLQPVLMLLRTCFFGIAQSDDAAFARQRISMVLKKLGSFSVDDLALLNEFLGVAEPGAAASALSPKARRARLLGLLRELVSNNGTKVSVIVFEDLHWLDEASAEFLAVLADAVAKTQTLLLLNYRPGYRVSWSALPHFRAIALKDLSQADTADLVRGLLSTRPALQKHFEVIVERSSGNPFFAEELVHSLVERSDFADSLGNQKNDVASLIQTLPANVQAVIGERIDRLVSAQRTLLHICAVIGKEIPLTVLEQVAVYLVSQVESGLNGLCEAELLQMLREIAGERRFAFRHPLIQEVAYNTQLKARRSNLHAAVAVAMEAHYSAEPGEFAALIAYHYASAGQLVNASLHEARAAKWAGSTNSAQAIKHWRKVWSLLEGQERSPQTNSLRAMAGGRIVYLGWREGLPAEEVQLITSEAIAIADGRMEQLLVFVQGRMLQSAGGPADDYVQCVQKALALSPSLQSSGREALLYVALSQAYTWAGLLKEALQASDAAASGLAYIDPFDRDFIDFSIVQWRLGIRARILIRLGQLDEAKRCIDEMRLADGGVNDPVIAQMLHTQTVEIAASLKDRSTAMEHSEKMEKIAEQHPSPYSRIYALWCMGLAAATAGEVVVAATHYAEGLALIEQTRVAVDMETEIQACFCELHYHCGNLSAAAEMARLAIDTSRRRNNRATEGRALLVLAGATGQGAAPDAQTQAQILFNQADELIAQTGATLFEQPLLRERERLVASWALVEPD